MRTRRECVAGALAVVAAACTGGKGGNNRSSPPSGGGTTIGDLTQGVPQLSLLGVGPGALGGDRTDPIQTGRSLITFDLALSQQLFEGGAPQVYVAKDENTPALGPFPGVWGLFTGYEKTGDHSPKTAIPGVYTAEVRVPAPGLWTFAAVGPG